MLVILGTSSVKMHSVVIKNMTLFFTIILVSSCVSLPQQHSDLKVNVMPVSFYENTALAKIFKQSEVHAHNYSGNTLLRNGHQAFIERLYLADVAQKTIDVQYFIWNSDQTGQLLLQKLLHAADRGIKVRILVDALTVAQRNDQLAILDHYPNVYIRVYNPSTARTLVGKAVNFVFDFDRLNQRMHNKSYIIDGTVAVTGGRNIGDEYFFYSKDVNFDDVDLLSVGPVVQQVAESFNEYWNSNWAIPITDLVKVQINEQEDKDIQKFVDANLSDFLGVKLIDDSAQLLKHFSDLNKKLIWAPTTFVADSPASEKNLKNNQAKAVATKLAEIVVNSKEEVLIESAYLSLDGYALSFFKTLQNKGVQIRALTNSMATNNLIINHASYAMFRDEMLNSGFNLFELKPTNYDCLNSVEKSYECSDKKKVALHAKSAVMDNKIMYIGSLNFNLRSAYINTESAMFIESTELAEQLTNQILKNMQLVRSWQVTKVGEQVMWMTQEKNEFNVTSQEPETTWLERVEVDVLTKMPGTEYY